MKNQYKIIIIGVFLILLFFLFQSDKFIGRKKENEKMGKGKLEKEESNKKVKEDLEEVEKKILTRNDSKYWIDKLEDKHTLLMDESQIIDFNKENFAEHDFLVDLRNHKSTIDKLELKKQITSFSIKPDETRYNSKGNAMDEAYFIKLDSNLNIDNIEKTIPIKYGLTTDRTILRKFPTAEPSYKKKDDIEFDRFAETAVYPWEPLIIYSESKDGQWYFCRMYNYIGWISKDHVAIGNKEDIFSKTNKGEFLIVIDKQISIDHILFDMGIKIPLLEEDKNHYIILLPQRDGNGELEFIEKKLAKSDKLNKGYLPYTRANIIEQGFKFLGESYGWGGMNNTRDCSGFIMDIHRTFGLKLPRNASQQELESIGKSYNLNDIENLPEATSLYMPGHTMLYIGEDQGEYFMLHQFQGYYEEQGDKLNYIHMMETAVTPVTIKLSTGQTYIDSVNRVKDFSK